MLRIKKKISNFESWVVEKFHSQICGHSILFIYQWRTYFFFF